MGQHGHHRDFAVSTAMQAIEYNLGRILAANDEKEKRQT